MLRESKQSVAFASILRNVTDLHAVSLTEAFYHPEFSLMSSNWYSKGSK